jgi:hypothetical protein
MVLKVVLPVLLVAVGFEASAQGPQAAQPPQSTPPVQSGADVFNSTPPGVEDALRARMKLFYDCYLTGKFRQAYDLVAEDSKDQYFNQAKTPYHSYKINSIQFSDNFTKAKVMVVVNRDFTFDNHTFPVDMPMMAYWKIENGQWVWYIIPRTAEERQTPFGTVYPETATSNAPTASESGKSVPKGPSDPSTMAAAFNRLAWPDKPVLTLGPAGHFQDHAVLNNHSPNPLKFHLEFNALPGLKLEPMKGEIGGGRSLEIHATYDSPDNTLPSDLSARPIKVVYESGGSVQLQIVWDKDSPAKSASR